MGYSFSLLIRYKEIQKLESLHNFLSFKDESKEECIIVSYLNDSLEVNLSFLRPTHKMLMAFSWFALFSFFSVTVFFVKM